MGREWYWSGWHGRQRWRKWHEWPRTAVGTGSRSAMHASERGRNASFYTLPHLDLPFVAVVLRRHSHDVVGCLRSHDEWHYGRTENGRGDDWCSANRGFVDPRAVTIELRPQ